jgi:hypothetical protein
MVVNRTTKKGTRMNATQLADELENTYPFVGVMEIAATMLRQQQAEIEELKAKLQLHEAMDNQCASLMQQFRKASEK